MVRHRCGWCSVIAVVVLCAIPLLSISSHRDDPPSAEETGKPQDTTDTTNTLKILPLGDSITCMGIPPYRYFLWHLLHNVSTHDYTKDLKPQCDLAKIVADQRHTARPTLFDFVGTQRGGSCTNAIYGEMSYAPADMDHEGHSGWTTEKVLLNVSTWTRKAAPDVVLVHLGTNDLKDVEENGVKQRKEGVVDETANEMRQLLAILTTVAPAAKIFVAKVGPTLGNEWTAPSQIIEYNQKLEAMVNDFNVASNRVGGHRIEVVDLFSALDPMIDLLDSVHPKDIGHKKMAIKWMEGLCNADWTLPQ